MTARPQVLLVASTTGYQVRSFSDAAARLQVDLLFATDRCHVLDDPWRDRAVPVRFHQVPDAVDAIATAVGDRPIDGVLAVGDRPAVVAAAAAERLGVRAHPTIAARRAANKRLTRQRLHAEGLPSPWFTTTTTDEPVAEVADRVTFPCVVKPVALSGSRGVIRADDRRALAAALDRVRQLLRSPDVVAARDPDAATVLVEGYLSGRELAVEGLMTAGTLQVLAIFDKPDPLEGPYFEETIYVTPAALGDREYAEVTQIMARAAEALGLWHGPIHGECRITPDGVFTLEVAARPIGGLCARALRFVGSGGPPIDLEELLVRHAVGRSSTPYVREVPAAGVMMIPIPVDGVYKGVTGLAAARAVDGIDEIVVTARRDQRIRPLPEGASYLGFIFARASTAADVVRALRAAHGRLQFEIAPPIPIGRAPG